VERKLRKTLGKRLGKIGKKIGKDWERLGKIGKDWERLGKIGKDWERLGKGLGKKYYRIKLLFLFSNNRTYS
jgi:hypothetical protein